MPAYFTDADIHLKPAIIYKVQWSAVIKYLIFFKMLTIDTPYLTRKGEIWGVFLRVRGMFFNVQPLHWCIMHNDWLLYKETQGPFHKQCFQRNSNLIQISFYCHLDSNKLIATKFCTWHDSRAVMACAKFCSEMIPYNRVTLNPIFHRICIVKQKSYVKWTGGCSDLIMSAFIRLCSTASATNNLHSAAC